MSKIDNLLSCRMCGYDRFHLYTHPKQDAIPEVRVLFGLLRVISGKPAVPERLTATCLRCSCVHEQSEIQGKAVCGAFG